MRCLCWHNGMLLCQTHTALPVLQHHQASPNLAAGNRWMTWIDSSMNERMVLTYLHVPVCWFVLCSFPRFSPFSLLSHLPHFSLLVFNVAYVCFMWWLLNFPTFPAPTFSPLSPFGLQCLFFFLPLFLLTHFPHFTFLVFKVLFFVLLCFLIVQGGSPMINHLSTVSRPHLSHFPCSHIFPLSPFGFQCLFFCLPLFLLTHFPHFPLLVFKVFFFVLPCFLLSKVVPQSSTIFQLCQGLPFSLLFF